MLISLPFYKAAAGGGGAGATNVMLNRPSPSGSSTELNDGNLTSITDFDELGMYDLGRSMKINRIEIVWAGGQPDSSLRVSLGETTTTNGSGDLTTTIADITTTPTDNTRSVFDSLNKTATGRYLNIRNISSGFGIREFEAYEQL